MPDCHIGNVDGSNLNWFPGYKAEVEESKKRKWCNWIMMWWILALIVGSIVCGLFVMQPGVVFQRFEPGQCTLKSLKFNYLKGCNCGKNCKSDFPCYTLAGTFDSNITDGSASNMDLFNSYWDYVKGCAFQACGKDRSENARKVYEKTVQFYKKHGYDTSKLANEMKEPEKNTIVDTLDSTKIISCYGDNNGTVFMTFVNSSLMIGLGTIPLIGLVFMVVAFIKFATPGMKIVTLRCIFMPYYCLTDRKTTTAYLCNHRGPCAKGYCCQ